MIVHKSPFPFIRDSGSNFRRGLDFQREKFKDCKHQNNYDGMCDSIENIKSEIKKRVYDKHHTDKLLKIEKIVNWYRNIESKYMRNTPSGKQLIFPNNIVYIVNRKLTIAYEVLIGELDMLDLL